VAQTATASSAAITRIVLQDDVTPAQEAVAVRRLSQDDCWFSLDDLLAVVRESSPKNASTLRALAVPCAVTGREPARSQIQGAKPKHSAFRLMSPAISHRR